MTDDKHTMGGRCPQRADWASLRIRVSLQGWWGPWPQDSSPSARALVPHAALWVLENLSPQSQPHADPLPSSSCWSFCLKPAIHQAPRKPRPHGSPGSNTTSAPSLVAEAREMARHTPPSPLGAPTRCPSMPGLPSPLCLLWRQHAGPDASPPLCPGHQLSLGIQEQRLCPGLTELSSLGRACPARAPEGPTGGVTLGAPVVYSPLGKALTCGGLGALRLHPGFLTLLRFQAHHRHTFSAEPSPS